MPGKYARGNVWQVDLNPVRGAEKGLRRPCVIVQNDVGNKYSPLTIIAVITDAKNVIKEYPVDVYVRRGEGGLTLDSVIQCNQIRAVDKGRLLDHLGKLSTHIMNQVDSALKISLQLP
ncbi:MAG TPA: type II toxin-antitoxin system PemK/MazF family toxin [Candidatus Hypogeohydataceae bacterium YC38]